MFGRLLFAVKHPRYSERGADEIPPPPFPPRFGGPLLFAGAYPRIPEEAMRNFQLGLHRRQRVSVVSL